MSDLQCPASLVFVVAGEDSRRQATELDLAALRVAVIYAGDDADAVRTAHALAATHQVPVTRSPELREHSPDEDEHDAVVRLSRALAAITDAHRGETVVVVGHPQVLGVTLPSLAVNVPASYAVQEPLRPAGTVEMRADADGWVLDSWMGARPD